jgi:hypothetical protein
MTRLTLGLTAFLLAFLGSCGSVHPSTMAPPGSGGTGDGSSGTWYTTSHTRASTATSGQRAGYPTGAITMPTKDINAYTGYSVDFAGTGTDPKGETLTGTWNFDDGQATTGLTVSHTYMHPGVYTVTFTVTNADGVSDPHPPTRTITVTTYRSGY